MKKPVIAIDGYSSTGKSSISKVIAESWDLFIWIQERFTEE
jgi:cytidylate kinase